MGVIGAIEDGIRGNYTILLVKGVIDGIIVMVMCSFMGRGAMFSFIPVGIAPTRSVDEPVLDNLLKIADENLYEAKRNGRNQVVSK